jgi:hypothetical protein
MSRSNFGIDTLEHSLVHIMECTGTEICSITVQVDVHMLHSS